MADSGLLFTLEGPEGAGKSTQLARLAERLRNGGRDVLVTREPGGTTLGEQLRSILITPTEQDIVGEAELLLFNASRAQLMRRVLLPHLEHGGIVLCDRFIDSTMAYQGYARGIDLAFIETLNRFAIAGRYPDRTFVLDLDIEQGFERTRKRANGTVINDRMEAQDRSFHAAVRNGFLDIAKRNPDRVKVIDASQSENDVTEAIWQELSTCL